MNEPMMTIDHLPDGRARRRFVVPFGEAPAPGTARSARPKRSWLSLRRAAAAPAGSQA